MYGMGLEGKGGGGGGGLGGGGGGGGLWSGRPGPLSQRRVKMVAKCVY